MGESLNNLFEESFKKNWDYPALNNYNGASFSYGDLSLEVAKVHHLFELINIKPGDKVALLGRNSAEWCIIYVATISYGAVIVPILPDFGVENTQHIILHSDSVLIFTSELLFEKIDTGQLPMCKGVVDISLGKIFYGNMQGALANFVEESANFHADRNVLNYPELDPELPAVISYTSGTSGFSKGVVLPLRSIYSNVRYGLDKIKVAERDPIVSFLPLAHAYGCLFEFLMPICMGCHVTLLTKIPTPALVMSAFKELKPRIVLSVPLVIEKIYERQIQPVIEKPHIKLLLSLPILRNIILKKICQKLKDAFGNYFYQIVIGGAPLNKSVEHFFMKMKFPFTIGYGMTECGPLISYSQFDEHRKGGTGKIVDRMECKIASKDPQNIPGEILVKGDNVMIGYYKDEESTKEVLTSDGWLKTGDLGVIDSDGFIYIKGRNKSMILGASGQNIYPEEIETVINHEVVVNESLVRENNGKLEALIFPQMELVESKKMSNEELVNQVMALKLKLNKKLPVYAQISMITIMNEEFEKTPKRSIKRYLYLEKNQN